MKAWETVKGDLRSEVGDATYTSWIAPLSVSSVKDGVVTLGAPSKFVCDRVQTTYGSKIRDAWRKSDPGVRRVVYQVGRPHHAEREEGRGPAVSASRDGLGAPPPASIGRSSARIGGGTDLFESISLNDRHRFERFVVGRPNEFASAAARRVAEDQSAPFNPLFLHGTSGSGKTHLLHAIAWRRKQLFPEDRVLFISAETFLMQFISAVRRQKTYAFKEMFRNVDMLIVDDVQHIVGKNYTQEEFFHTFDALADRDKQIVLSGTEAPVNMHELDERLRSRLGGGLVAEIYPADYELRLGILESKAEAALERTPGIQIDRKVLDFLAQRISSDVRTLEGALNRLIAIASLNARPITVEMAQRDLQDLLRNTDRKISVEEIQRRVAEHYSIQLSDMHSPRRARAVARPRQVAMYLCKVLTAKSLPDIGKKFGGRDHTTVMHAVKKITSLRETDSVIDDDVERLRRALES